MGCARKNKSWNFRLASHKTWKDLSLTASALNTTRHIPVTNTLCTVNNHQFSHVGHNENLFLCYTDVADTSSRWQYETILSCSLYINLSLTILAQSFPHHPDKQVKAENKKRAKQLRNWKHVKVVEAVVEDGSWEDNRRTDQRREER